ncbi:hypothetical protein [Myxococcus eversor]|uniref:hypothetical protein n=1 Tax=Myxococcus eversor TaxID=2709661 RepID=UPI0013D266B0|nr:hypothetical protein [Myxococcus eversor]
MSDEKGYVMEVSGRAQRLIAEAGEWRERMTPQDTAAGLSRDEAPVSGFVVELQRRWGGLSYRIGTSRTSFGLWSDRYGGPKELLFYELDGEDVLYEFVMKLSFQFSYSVGERGVFCEDEYVYSSVEKLIEDDAVSYELFHDCAGWWRCQLNIEDHGLITATSAIPGVAMIPEASDERTSWWRGDNLWIRRGPVLFTPGRSYVEVSAQDRGRAESIRDSLLNRQGV